jgi:hypothetical protein
MRGEYTALLKQDGDWWIGWIEEVPGVSCQERTRDALLASLRLTLRQAQGEGVRCQRLGPHGEPVEP